MTDREHLIWSAAFVRALMPRIAPVPSDWADDSAMRAYVARASSLAAADATTAVLAMRIAVERTEQDYGRDSAVAAMLREMAGVAP